MTLTNLILAANNNQQGKGSWIVIVLYVAVIIGAGYFMIFRPQKKQKKKEEELRNSMQAGDEIITIGGIYGRIVSIKDDSLVIESMGDRSLQRIAKWAVQQNLTVHDVQEKADGKKK